MSRWGVVLALVIMVAFGTAIAINAPAMSPAPAQMTMLASDGLLPEQVHHAGHETVAAYQAAIDHPEALAAVPCLCGCIQTLGHDNNLECYIESHHRGVTLYTSHGLNCLICHRITEDAVAGAASGMKPAQLHAMIVEKYGS